MARRCHYCNHHAGKTIDHIVPKALGGPNTQWNYVRACTKCNGDKGHSWPECPCGICQLAIEMFLWCKERGGGHTLAISATELFRARLWEERVERAGRWEDAAWIKPESIVGKSAARRIAKARQQKRVKEPVAPHVHWRESDYHPQVSYDQWLAQHEWTGKGWQKREESTG